MDYYIYYINILNKYNKGMFFLIAFFLPIFSIAQDHKEIQLANEYLLKGEKKKAVEIFSHLAKRFENTSLIYNNYFNAMLDLGMMGDAQEYIKRLLKRDPSNLQYRLDQGILYFRSGDLSKADKYFRDIITENKPNAARIKMVSDYLAGKSLIDYSIVALNESRSFFGNPNLFALELAMFYRIKGQKEKMVQEYLVYVTQNSNNVQYVKNVLQMLLTKPEELAVLQKLLQQKIQQNPNAEVYLDILIWVSMQQKDFYGAFLQARAYDKRFNKEGEKCMEVAKVALSNQDYLNATKIYKFVIREFPLSQQVMLAQLGLIHTRESRIKSTYPVNRDSVRLLITNYDSFIAQYPQNTNAYEAVRNKALLMANYLDDNDGSIRELKELIARANVSLTLKSRAKLDLGDIYLSKGEGWESSLLYSQVEKNQKESLIGYEAKLKNAKLSYYNGDFLLAMEHLDILKEATTREISNDAMELSLRIKENIAYDSSGKALKVYAGIELLLHQNKMEEALAAIQQLKEGRFDTMVFSNQGILDDVYWLEAKLNVKKGNFTQALELLQKIIDEFSQDILSDDAMYLKGEIYEKHLKDKEKAMETYRVFLNNYQGSVYTSEVRKRYRILRGDYTESELSPNNQ